MTRKKDSGIKDARGETCISITGLLTSADVERVKKAFSAGELKGLDVVEITVSPARGRWTNKESRKENSASDSDLPPH